MGGATGDPTEAGVELGVTYPHPIVDVKLSREAALAAFSNLRQIS